MVEGYQEVAKAMRRAMKGGINLRDGSLGKPVRQECLSNDCIGFCWLFFDKFIYLPYGSIK